MIQLEVRNDTSNFFRVLLCRSKLSGRLYLHITNENRVHDKKATELITPNSYGIVEEIEVPF